MGARAKVDFPSWVTALATVVLVGVTTCYVRQTDKMLKLSSVQALVTNDPVVRVEPTPVVEGQLGEFELVVHNTGLADIESVDVYYDPFVVVRPSSSAMRFHYFGAWNMLPKHSIGNLPSGQKAQFPVVFSETLPAMSDFYSSPDVKGARMMILRIILRYRRSADGRQFDHSTVYTIAGRGDVLLNDYEREVGTSSRTISLGEVRQALGIEAVR